MTGKAVAGASSRRGRPPGTSRRELELIALRLFTDQGFDSTTIEQIAAEAGVSRRTFFRYFSSKANVLWSEFDHEVDVIRVALGASASSRITVSSAGLFRNDRRRVPKW